MTGVDEATRKGWTRPLRPYLDIFSVPGAWRFSAAGVIGRMPMSMFGLGTVLLISAVTGKYGVAGAVSAAGSLGYAFTSPRVARAVDSHGQRRVLLPLLAVFATATALLIVAVQLQLPTWAFFVPGAIAGATMPSLGAMVRARRSHLLADCSGRGTASETLQRARTIAPSDGMVAPAIAPGTKNAQVGSRSCTVTMSSAVATA